MGFTSMAGPRSNCSGGHLAARRPRRWWRWSALSCPPRLAALAFLSWRLIEGPALRFEAARASPAPALPTAPRGREPLTMTAAGASTGSSISSPRRSTSRLGHPPAAATIADQPTTSDRTAIRHESPDDARLAPIRACRSSTSRTHRQLLLAVRHHIPKPAHTTRSTTPPPLPPPASRLQRPAMSSSPSWRPRSPFRRDFAFQYGVAETIVAAHPPRRGAQPQPLHLQGHRHLYRRTRQGRDHRSRPRHRRGTSRRC